MAGPRPLRRNPNPVVAAVAAVWAVWAALALFVTAVDPYDLHPWGAPTSLPGAFEPFDGADHLAIAVKDVDADLVLIGSSPTTPYTPSDLRRAWPKARRPWNVSLHGGLAGDRLVTMDTFARGSRAGHYLITVDAFLAAPNMEARQGFPFHAYDRAIWNDLRVLTPRAVRDSLTVLRHGSPRPDPGVALRAERENNLLVARLWRSEDTRARLREAVVPGAPAIADAPARDCADFPVARAFMRSVARLRATGARVDLLIPTYSSALWFGWAQEPERLRAHGPHMLADQLAMRRCVVVAAAALGVAVHAQNPRSPSLNDLREFRDPGHLRGSENLAAFISLPRDPSTRLTPDNFEAYAEGVRQQARSFDPEAPW